MCRPGATRSGLLMPSAVVPYDENEARRSSVVEAVAMSSVAPTAMTKGSVAGAGVGGRGGGGWGRAVGGAGGEDEGFVGGGGDRCPWAAVASRHDDHDPAVPGDLDRR